MILNFCAYGDVRRSSEYSVISIVVECLHLCMHALHACMHGHGV